MRGTQTTDQDLVLAAQAGDRRALAELFRVHLPLVYTIVRRALNGHPDADDVVQDTVLRAVGALHDLRSPESFRPWLAGIAIRQVGTHLHRRRAAAARATPLEELIGSPDPAADVEGVTTLEADLSRQRRQVVRASRWLDPDDRTLLSLWWLEVAGQLSRAEVAQALGVTVAHAGIRVQRMRAQLDASRALVSALEARPRCARLAAVISGWNGRPSPLWRKRMARHVRSCAQCSLIGAETVAAERLLVGYVLLPVPAAVTAGLLGKLALGATAAGGAATIGSAGAAVGVGAKAGFITQVVQAVMANPVAASVAAGAVVAGAAVTAVTLTEPPPPRPAIAAPTSAPVVAPLPVQTRATRPVARPSPTRAPAGKPSAPPTPAPPPGQLPLGPVSLEAVGQTGKFVSTTGTYGVLAAASSDSDASVRKLATFDVVVGLADPDCVSFRLPDGTYLRHSSWRLRVFAKTAADTLLEADATFCVQPGSVPGSIAFASYNYPSYFLHIRGEELWVDPFVDSAQFRADTSFRARPPLAGG